MKHILNKSALILTVLVFVMLASCSKKDNPAPPVIAKPTVASFAPTAASTGDTVTLTGTNFTGATAVSFGGSAAASFKVVSATSIQAVLGAGATGDVSVVTPGGTATLPGFTLNAPRIDGYNSSNEVGADNLIGYWPFDGSTNEKIHNAAPVLTGGGQTFVAGRIGQAVHLEAGWLTYGPEATAAGNDNTTFNSNDTLQNGFTISVWAQVEQTSLLSTLFQLSTPGIPNWPILGLNYRKNDGNAFDIDGGVGNVDGTGPHISYAAAFMEPGFVDSLDWAHIVISYNGSDKSMKYYANGILRKTIDLSTLVGGPFPDPTASLLMITPNYPTIGTFEGTTPGPNGVPTTPGDAGNVIPDYMSNGITGNIDDIRFYNIGLSESDVKALYDLGSAGR